MPGKPPGERSPVTFIDRRRNTVRSLVDTYGGDPAKVEEYLDMWLKARLRQVDVEMVIARDCGATGPELAEQFGYSNAVHATGVVARARRKYEEAINDHSGNPPEAA